MSIAYRDGRPDDVPYIVATWRKCILEGHEYHSVDDAVKFRGVTARIVRLLEKSSVRVACDPEVDTNIVGFAVFSGDVGHFRYVRERFRKHGIAGGMVQGAAILVCTHRPQGHAPGKMRQTFNPFLLEAS